MSTCIYESYGKQCGRELFDEIHCIFHSNKIDNKSEFTTSFWKEFENQCISKELLDFTGFIFPIFFQFKRVCFEKPVCFDDATFPGLTDFSGCVFKGSKTSFNRTRFLGETSFLGASFWGNSLDFIGTVFFKNATSFHSVNFNSENTLFYLVNCTDHSDYLPIDLNIPENYSWHSGRRSDAQFLTQLFNGDWEDGLSFDHAKFTGNIQFSESNFFFGILSFNNAEFLTKFNFHYIKINLDNFTLANAKFFMGGEIDFFDFHAKTINLSNTIFKGRVNFTIGSIFFKNLEIINAHFSDATGLDKLFVSTGNNGKIKFKLKEYKFFLGPNSAARYPILHKKNQDAWFLYEFKSQHPLIFNIWKFTSNCGQSLLRWSIISFFIALIFGLIYGFVGIPGFEMKHQTWFSFFYYSIVTFTTLGFGDITPKIWYTEILVSIEVIIGYFMLGGLVSIFSNKFARRS